MKKLVCTSVIALISFLHAMFMKIGENDYTHEIRLFFLIIDLMGGGGNICQKFRWVSLCLQKHSDWMPCTSLKCVNTNFICYATQLPGGGAFFFLIQNMIYFWGGRSTLANYCKHFSKSICTEFISPLGYFSLKGLWQYSVPIKICKTKEIWLHWANWWNRHNTMW